MKFNGGTYAVAKSLTTSVASGLVSAVKNADGTITLTYSDGTVITTQPIKGDKGDQGDPLTWADLTDEQKESLKGEDGKTVQILENATDAIKDEAVLIIDTTDAGTPESYTKTQSDVKYAKASEVGDITKLTVNTWTDLVDAINKTWNAGAGAFVFDATTRCLNITTRGGQTLNIDVSQIILNTNITDFKDMLVTSVLDGQSLVWNASKKKWVNKSIDSSGVLVEAKTYTDDEIKKINAKTTIVCDEKPTYYGGVTTYKKGGVEKTTEQTGVWFYYHDDDGNASQTIFPDGTEFTISMTGDVDLDGYLQDEDVTDTYDKDFVDKTKIPNTQYMSDFKADIDDELSEKVNTDDVTDTLGLSADGTATMSTVSEDKIPNLKALNELHTMLNGTLFKKADIIKSDDTTTIPADTNVYSAFKVDKLIDDLIDDATASDDKVYSSEKIEEIHKNFNLKTYTRFSQIGITDINDESFTLSALLTAIPQDSTYTIRTASANRQRFFDLGIIPVATNGILYIEKFGNASVSTGYVYMRFTRNNSEDNSIWERSFDTGSSQAIPEWEFFASKKNIYNPNLLDNPWFTVNQRGQTSYSAQGYTFDRWRLGLEGGTVTKLDDGSIRFEKTTTSYNLNVVQYIPLDGLIIGKAYTLSVKMADGTIFSGSGNMVSSTSLKTLININIPNYGVVALKTNPADNKNYVLIQGTGDVGSSIDVRAVKLELGIVSTLANDVAPDYGAELLKCQISNVDANDTYANKVAIGTLTDISDKFVAKTIDGLTISEVYLHKCGNVCQLSFRVVTSDTFADSMNWVTIANITENVAPSVGFNINVTPMTNGTYNGSHLWIGDTILMRYINKSSSYYVNVTYICNK